MAGLSNLPVFISVDAPTCQSYDTDGVYYTSKFGAMIFNVCVLCVVNLLSRTTIIKWYLYGTGKAYYR